MISVGDGSFCLFCLLTKAYIKNTIGLIVRRIFAKVLSYFVINHDFYAKAKGTVPSTFVLFHAYKYKKSK